MASDRSKEVHFVIRVGGQDKRLVTAFERDNGDLVVIPRRAAYARPISDCRDPATVFRGDLMKFKHAKYSVHQTLDNPSVNEIKKELDPNPEQIRFIHRTEAIKVFDEFAPLFFRIPADLRNARYDLSRDRKCRERIELGKMDPVKYQIRLLVCVSRRERAFNLNATPNLRAAHADFENFRLTLIWGFRRIPMGPGFESDPHFDERPTNTLLGVSRKLVTFTETCLYQFFEESDRLAVESFIIKANGQDTANRLMQYWGKKAFRLVKRGYDL